MTRSHSRGSSLIELVTTMVVAGVVLGSSLVGTGRLRDRWATEAARDAAIGLFFEARSRAIAEGGASLEVDTTGARFRLRSGDRDVTQDLSARYGVRLRMGRRRSRTFVYDAAGVGRVANGTLLFERGASTAPLVVSQLGRVRP